MQNDFLNYVEVVGNIWDNEISELVAQHCLQRSSVAEVGDFTHKSPIIVQMLIKIKKDE